MSGGMLVMMVGLVFEGNGKALEGGGGRTKNAKFPRSVSIRHV